MAQRCCGLTGAWARPQLSRVAADYGRRAARPGLALRRQSDPPSDWRRRACPIFFNLSFITWHRSTCSLTAGH